MHNILLFKATEIASSLAQHRISRVFTVHDALIKRCLEDLLQRELGPI